MQTLITFECRTENGFTYKRNFRNLTEAEDFYIGEIYLEDGQFIEITSEDSRIISRVTKKLGLYHYKHTGYDFQTYEKRYLDMIPDTLYTESVNR